MSSYRLIANALHIHELILNRRIVRLTKPRIAKKLGVSEKQVTNAIDFLKVMGYPAVYDERTKCWSYDWENYDRRCVVEDVLAPRLEKLPKADLGILLMLQRGREFLRNTPLFVEAERFLNLLEDDRLSVVRHQLRDLFSYQSRPVNQDGACFEAVAAAVYERKQIVFSYRKPEEKTPSERRVDPHHMTCCDEMWYLLGWDHGRGEIRTFALPRMKGVRRTGETFEPLPREQIDAQLEHAFRMVGKGGRLPPQVVRLRFSPAAAVRVKERRWHVSQEVQELPGGECEVILELASFSEVERWVLGWGADCTVVAPPELVKRVRESALAIVSRYGPS